MRRLLFIFFAVLIQIEAGDFTCVTNGNTCAIDQINFLNQTERNFGCVCGDDSAYSSICQLIGSYCIGAFPRDEIKCQCTTPANFSVISPSTKAHVLRLLMILKSRAPNHKFSALQDAIYGPRALSSPCWAPLSMELNTAKTGDIHKLIDVLDSRSRFNPCGHHGRCVLNLNQWRFECKCDAITTHGVHCLGVTENLF